jgi:uncharacterized protein (TIGR00730 family)
MSTIRRVCVYCGSGPGANPAFVTAARTLGRILAEKHIGLVYGGGSVGLMGELANAVLDRGGEAIGVIPTFLMDKEHVLGRGQIIETRDMHERKQRMFDLADAFVALPGGIGTLEELFEVWTWSQLGLHAKPCALLDIAGFYGGLAAFMDHVVAEGFLKPQQRQALLVERDGTALLERMMSY